MALVIFVISYRDCLHRIVYVHRLLISGEIINLCSYRRLLSLVSPIDLFTDSDAILKILSVDFCGKVKVNSDSSSKIVEEYKFSHV